MAINYEQFNEMRDSLTASDFRSVLSYYGLTIERNGFLCPFHQSEHHQNCRIRSNGKSAYCYVCNRPINAVDITQYFEGGTPLEAGVPVGTDTWTAAPGKGRAETAHPELQIPSYDRTLPSHRHQYGDSE